MERVVSFHGMYHVYYVYDVYNGYDGYDGCVRAIEEVNPTGRSWGEIDALWFLGCLSLTGVAPNSNTSEPLSVFVFASATIYPEFSSHFPSLHTSLILSLVYSRLDISSSRQNISATTVPLLQISQISHFFRHGKASIKRWMVSHSRYDSLPRMSCSLRLSIIGRWLVHNNISCLEPDVGKLSKQSLLTVWPPMEKCPGSVLVGTLLSFITA